MRIPSVAELQARGKRLAEELQRQNKQKIDFATNGGRRALTKAEIERIAREGADFLRNRLK